MKEQKPCPHCGSKGFVEVIVPPSTPPGFVEVLVISSYYGSHPEYGGRDREFRIAVPEGTVLPSLKLSHGDHGNTWKPLEELPPSALIAEEQDEEWTPIRKFLVDEG